jgi:hypothetical protein
LWAAPTSATPQPAQSQTPGLAYTPAQVNLSMGSDAVSIDAGKGQTVALVEPIGEPDIAADLNKFDTQFGLPAPPSLVEVNLHGGTPESTPARVDGLSLETALDVEWAHATAPAAKLVLVVANSDNPADVTAAARTALSISGVTTVFANPGQPPPIDGSGAPPGQIDSNVLFMNSPASGYAVFDSSEADGRAGWWSVGGDRAQTPQGVGLILVANQSGAFTAAGRLTAAQTAAVTDSGYNVTTGLGWLVAPDAGTDGDPGIPLSLDDPHVVSIRTKPTPGRFRPSTLHGGTPSNPPAAHSVTPLAQAPTNSSGAVFLATVNVRAAASGYASNAVAPMTNPLPASGDSHHLTGLPSIALISPERVGAAVRSAIMVAETAGATLALASNDAADALSAVASAQPLADVLSYNFVHFSPAVMLHDALASFSHESALALSPSAGQVHHANLAWAVTMAVVAGDVLFVGYWYHRTRCAGRRGRMSVARLEIDPCPGRLL